jgi:hypothetical protein
MQQEVAMLAPETIEPITLPARTVHRIEAGQGQRVTCVRGPVWITQERDERDTILAAGQSFVLDRPGVAVVFAFRGATITVASAWQVPATASVPVRADAERAWA